MIAMPRTDRMISYPGTAVHPGYTFWSSYSGAQATADLTAIKGLGFNVVRIPLTARTNVFNFPSPTTGQLANLVDLYNRGKSLGLKFRFILFDDWNYSSATNSETWVNAVLSALPDYAAIQALELQNEQRWSVASYQQQGLVAWNVTLMAYLRALIPTIPIVQAVGFKLPDLTAAIAAIEGTAAQPDWYDWHVYCWPFSPYQSIQHAMTIVGDPSRIAIGEFGVDASQTNNAAAGSTSELRQHAVNYAKAMRWSCQELGLPEPAPWAYGDLGVGGQFSTGQQFGLIDLNGLQTPLGAYYQSIAQSSGHIASTSMNDTVQTIVTDTNGNTLPATWRVFLGNSGSEPITVGYDPSLGAAVLTGSSGSSTSSPPAIALSNLSYPLITGGQSYKFRVQLKATGSFGSPNLIVLWYAFDPTYGGGAYAGYSAAAVSLTSTFAVYTITATAPATAVFAVLNIGAGNNGGTIWAKDPRITGPNGRLLANGGHWYRR